MLTETDLLLNADGSIYHLGLHPGELADTIILVGDPERVPLISRHFDQLYLKKSKREFVSHTGRMGEKELTVVSTGIGTDNIDIVLHELDALVNIDFNTRTVKPEFKRLRIIRLGTAGALRFELPDAAVLVSSYAIGLDNLMHFYPTDANEPCRSLLEAFQKRIHLEGLGITPYCSQGAIQLLNHFIQPQFIHGITVTTPGFYGPQGRSLRKSPLFPDLFGGMKSFEWGGQFICNFEMETAGIYGLGAFLGHQCLSLSVLINNRIKRSVTATPLRKMEEVIPPFLETVQSL